MTKRISKFILLAMIATSHPRGFAAADLSKPKVVHDTVEDEIPKPSCWDIVVARLRNLGGMIHRLLPSLDGDPESVTDKVEDISDDRKISHINKDNADVGQHSSSSIFPEELDAYGTIIDSAVIGSEHSDDALKMILATIERNIRANICSPEASIAVFDIDETVLVVSGNSKPRGIRQSHLVLKRLQQLGLRTLFLTIRDVVPANVRPWLSANLGVHPEWEKYLNYQFQTAQDDLRTVGIDIDFSARGFGTDNFGFYDALGNPDRSGFFRLVSDRPFNGRDKAHLGQILHYGNGVIMASHHSKGEALKTLLGKHSLTDEIKCIYFADDEVSNIEDMIAAYQDTGGHHVFTFHLPKP